MSETIKALPVLLGQGEVTLKTKALNEAQEPLALMEIAARRALEDAGLAGALQHIDSLDVVAEYSWPYADAPAQLAQQLGIAPARLSYGEVGGESPLRFIHEAALRIQRGESRAALVVGAEAEYSVQAARKAGANLPWSPRSIAPLKRGVSWLHPLAVQLGVAAPPSVYPFFENASLAAWGQTPAQALQESGRLWADFSRVAQGNAAAWTRQAFTPEDITHVTPENRLIAWPYSVRVIANPQVNQGAAVLLMDAVLAQALGAAPEKFLYLQAGAAAAEPEDYLQRANYSQVPAQQAVLDAVHAPVFDSVELYSCFPVVPKMARRAAGLAEGSTLTTTGGLSLFGAPLNNYMTHAVAAMMRELRRQRGATARRGLLYGQGGYACTHHALVLSTQPPAAALSRDYSVQAAADARRGPVPALDIGYQGPAVLETHTTLFERDGTPRHGVVIARSAQQGQTRLLARVAPEDVQAIGRLTDSTRSPVGLPGQVYRAADGLPHWQFTSG